MKLYYSPGACALASQIVLREAGNKFELVKVDLKNKTSSEGDFKKVNPKGYVPALKLDDGEILTEGAVILQWIADHAPDKRLIPKFGTQERYHAMEWLNFISTELHKGFSPLFGQTLNEEARAAVVARIHLRLDFVNTHLKTHQYMLGTDFSVVDAYLFNMIRWTSPTKIDVTPYTAIMDLMERLTARPSVRAAVEAEGLKL